MAEETGAGGEAVSVLRLRALAPGDGGRYSCRAHNAHGAAEHSARLNVYGERLPPTPAAPPAPRPPPLSRPPSSAGPPSVRAVGPVRVVAGANATVYCPYAGYPIRSIEVHSIGDSSFTRLSRPNRSPTWNPFSIARDRVFYSY